MSLFLILSLVNASLCGRNLRSPVSFVNTVSDFLNRFGMRPDNGEQADGAPPCKRHANGGCLSEMASRIHISKSMSTVAVSGTNTMNKVSVLELSERGAIATGHGSLTCICSCRHCWRF